MTGRTKRLNVRFLLPLVLLILVVPGLGCRTGAMGVSPAKSFVVPEWNSLDVRTLAFMGLGNAAGDEIARQTAEQVVEQGLLSGQDRFVILGAAESRSRASSRGAGETFGKLVKVWRNHHTADQFLVKELCEKAGVDGLLFGDLTDWKKEKVDWTQEGQSMTQVGLRLCILSGKTGAVAWEASQSKTKESLKYTPSEATGVYTDRSGVSRAERPDRIGPEPPKPEEVADEVMQAILAAFPPAPAAR